jgi:hypothetical protein
MADIRIFGKTLSEQEVERLKALLAEAGCDPLRITVIDSIGHPDPDCEDEIVLLLATSATCSAPILEKEMANVMNGSRRAIWVWPMDGAPAVPEATKKYSYSVVPWNAGKLAAVIADDDMTCFELPTGQPLPKEKTERNLCIEETKKPKS